MDVRYNMLKSTVRFIIFLPDFFVPNEALQCLRTVI